MKTIISLFAVALLTLAITALKAPEKTYRCLPCGRSCDDEVHHAAGKCGSCGMQLVDSETIKFKTLSFEDLCKRLRANKDIVLLDVRSPEEYNNQGDREAYGKFKNSININVTELQRRVGEISRFKNKEVIVYCSHSHRSPEASYFLSTHGFTNVANVAGGVSQLHDDAVAPCLKDVFVRY